MLYARDVVEAMSSRPEYAWRMVELVWRIECDAEYEAKRKAVRRVLKKLEAAQAITVIKHAPNSHSYVWNEKSETWAI